MMTMTTPEKLAMASGAARAAIQTAGEYVGRAAGDYGIDASDNNARILHDCIERQQDAIGALWRMVDELQAQVAQLVENQDKDEADDEVDLMDDHRRARAVMAAWPRPEGGES